MNAYADWKAPKADMQFLIWPDAARIMADARQNHASLASATIAIQNAPLAELRGQTRAFIGHDDARLLIATGHQVELYHPGVWAKNVLLDSLRSQYSDVDPLHVAVDTDSPKHLQLRWPGGAIDVSDDLLLKTGEWAGQVAQPTIAHLQKLQTRLGAAETSWGFAPAVTPFLKQMRSQATQSSIALPTALLSACAAVDHSLGLRHASLVLSPMLQSPGYLALVHHIAADIERFAAVYNQALADYRSEAGIRSTTRPMPDLRVSDDTIELPFWFDNLATGERSRARVTRLNDSDHWHLLIDDAAFAFDPTRDATSAIDALREFCKIHGIRLSPRALTLTTFFRLMLVDQFVHGIGGGRYDQVTDRLIECYFGIAAPAFCVTTATMFFPNAGERTDASCVPCLVTEGHRLKHSLMPKAAYLQTIKSAPPNSAKRKSAYRAMHAAREKVVAQTSLMADWRERLEKTIARQVHEKVLFDRELFYALQPRDRLLSMIQTYQTAVKNTG